MEKLVIIPTYNEKENVAQMLDSVFDLHQGYHVLVVDDSSPDGTADIVRTRLEKYPGLLFLVERKAKSGLGTAYLHGFRWALNRTYQYIFEMDCDFSHRPSDLEKLYNTCSRENIDVAIGSRYISGGKIKNWPEGRVLLSKGASLYTRLITFMPVKDPTAGFVCYKRKVLEAINFDQISFLGYAFQIEMKFAAWKLGFKIKEVPITFTDRKKGISKMNKGIIQEGIFGVPRLKWQSLFKNYRNKLRSDAESIKNPSLYKAQTD